MQTNIFQQIAISNINKLVECLNVGRVKREIYKLIAVEPFGEYYILEVINGYNQRTWNLVNKNGEIPKNMPVNFRNLNIILTEIHENK